MKVCFLFFVFFISQIVRAEDNLLPPSSERPGHLIPRVPAKPISEKGILTIETTFANASAKALQIAIENLEQVQPPLVSTNSKSNSPTEKDIWSPMCMFNSRRTEAIEAISGIAKSRLDALIPGMTDPLDPESILEFFPESWKAGDKISWPEKEKWKERFNAKTPKEQLEIIRLSYVYFLGQITGTSRSHSYALNPETLKLTKEQRQKYAAWMMRYPLSFNKILDLEALGMGELKVFIELRESIIFNSQLVKLDGSPIGGPRPAFGYADEMCSRSETVHSLDSLFGNPKFKDYCARARGAQKIFAPSCEAKAEYFLKVATNGNILP